MPWGLSQIFPDLIALLPAPDDCNICRSLHSFPPPPKKILFSFEGLRAPSQSQKSHFLLANKAQTRKSCFLLQNRLPLLYCSSVSIQFASTALLCLKSFYCSFEVFTVSIIFHLYYCFYKASTASWKLQLAAGSLCCFFC